MQELGHKFGSDSVFWMSYKDFLRKYQYFDRTRLFHHQPEWVISQEWTSLDVPWRTDYQEKFRITLTEDSPVVVVLSQLDDRYFKGLEGQYQYTLQFRLHELGSQDPEDYIVRSHGNYLMNRSVSVELKTLKSGKYSVFVKVHATRNLKKSSAEDVVKKICREKKHNEKLLQVGHAYDVAHSKGSGHLTQEIKMQRVRERKAKKKLAQAAAKKSMNEMGVTLNAAIPEEVDITRAPVPSVSPETTTGGNPTPQTSEPDKAAQQTPPSPPPDSEQTRREATTQSIEPPATQFHYLVLHNGQPQYRPGIPPISLTPEDTDDDSSSEDVYSRRKRHGNEDRGWSGAEPYETDDENDAKPWNAVCVIGFKVYSKDKGLTIKIVPSSRGKEAAMDPDDIQVDAVEDVKWTDCKKGKGKDSQGAPPDSKSKEEEKEKEKGKETQEAPLPAVPTKSTDKGTSNADAVFTGLE